MFCPKCGFQNEEGSHFCQKCGADLTVGQDTGNNGQSYGSTQQPYVQQPNQWEGGYPNPQYPNNPYAGQPGYPAPGYYPAVNNHMVLAIVSIFFNLLFGILAIVFSNKSKTSFNMGDYNGAMSSARTAQILAVVGIVLGVLTIVGYIAGNI